MSAYKELVASAKRLIENGLHEYQSEEGFSDASMLTVALEAQVKATLALAEQQRIANIIALASLRIRPDQVPPLLHLAVCPVGEFGTAPKAEIADVLGIEKS